MSRTAWLVLAVSVAAVAAVLAAAYVRDHPRVDLGRKVNATASQSGVELHSTISIAVDHSVYEALASVTIVNTTDAPIFYAGDPAMPPPTSSSPPGSLRLPGRSIPPPRQPSART